MARTKPLAWSIQTATASVPVASLSLGAPLVIALVALLLVAGGVLALRRRDILTH